MVGTDRPKILEKTSLIFDTNGPTSSWGISSRSFRSAPNRTDLSFLDDNVLFWFDFTSTEDIGDCTTEQHTPNGVIVFQTLQRGI